MTNLVSWLLENDRFYDQYPLLDMSPEFITQIFYPL